MNFLTKKQFNMFFLLLHVFFAGNVNAGQKPGGLAAAREREKAANIDRRKVNETRRTIRRQSLEKQQGIQAKHYGVDLTPIAEIEAQTTPDRYTQSEAHLQIESVREELAKEPLEKIIPHLDTIADCLVKEVEMQKTHYVFYHTTENLWRVAQDVYTQLYSSLNDQKGNEAFKFLRFGEFKPVSSAKEFLLKELAANGLIDDNGKLGAVLLSVNLALFGNIGFPSECTWEYFLRERKHKTPDNTVYVEMMKDFKVTDKYIDEIMSLVSLIDTDEKTLLQIFIPKDKVDSIGYLAWATGIPAHEGVIDWVKTNIKKKSFTYKEDRHVSLWVLEELAGEFKEEQGRNPLYKDMIETVKEGDYSLASFLKVYCNQPWELPNINNVQARLIFSPDVLLNPSSGMQVYRYSTINHTKLAEYHNRLNEIVKKIINESKPIE